MKILLALPPLSRIYRYKVRCNNADYRPITDNTRAMLDNILKLRVIQTLANRKCTSTPDPPSSRDLEAAIHPRRIKNTVRIEGVFYPFVQS